MSPALKGHLGQFVGVFLLYFFRIFDNWKLGNDEEGNAKTIYNYLM